MRLQLVPTMTPMPEPRRSSGNPLLVPEISDEELVRRVGRKDNWAEEVTYRRYAPVVLGVARRMLGSQSEAEDVAQETFVTAFGIWEQLREPSRLKQWLLQIAVRKVHRIFRRRRLAKALGLASGSTNQGLAQWARPEAGADVRMELALLDKVLAQINPANRIAWMLRYVEGLSLDEVAFECSCSLATVKRRVASAHQIITRSVELEVTDG